MNNELKPCPICGKTEQVVCEVHVCLNWESADVCCERCGVQIIRDGRTAEEARERVIEAWNTRAERTCKDEGPYWCWFECSECGCIVRGGDELGHNSSEGAFNYCPSCGARVVE